MLLTETTENITSVQTFEASVLPRLSESDDAQFWVTVFNDLAEEFESLCIDELESYDIFFQIGACSHWLRPHQFRLKAAGGFAYPSGYSESWYGCNALPEFDWFVIFHFDKTQDAWLKSDKFFGKRKLVCRVVLPTRTLRHNQAVVNVSWSPGTPEQPKQKAKTFLAYRKIADQWMLAATGAL